MNIARHGPFDAAFVCGLLYHLDRPRAFLADAASVCRRIIMVHTHVAHEVETPARAEFHLSELTENEGAVGRWYTEYGDAAPTQNDTLREASWSNRHAFWLTRKYLLQTLRDCGFDTVFECFDLSLIHI